MIDRLLNIAIKRYWKRDYSLPVDLASRLYALGVDVEAVQSEYI